MAKRKRLSPLPSSPPPSAAPTVLAEPAPEVKSAPMATHRPPIADISADTAAHAAFEEVAGELKSARDEGRMVLRIAFDRIVADHLIRDRTSIDREELESLKASIRDRGQQTPIEVVELEGGQYGLLSGWRRLRAITALYRDSGHDDARYGHVLALVRKPETAADAYRAMVEENEIRADLSFYERARIAVKAAEMGLYSSPKVAVAGLFAAARAPKRSKITTFTHLVSELEAHLHHPGRISEKLGLKLASALQSDRSFRRRVTEALRKAGSRTPDREREVLERALKAHGAGPADARAPAASNAKAEEIAPGLSMALSGRRLTLSGDRVDGDFARALAAWLRENV